MKTVEFKVAGHVNYDAKMAGKIVTALSDVSSNVFIISANARVNAKSIMGMMTLGLSPGEEVTVTADGADEKEAIQSIEQYLSAK